MVVAEGGHLKPSYSVVTPLTVSALSRPTLPTGLAPDAHASPSVASNARPGCRPWPGIDRVTAKSLIDVMRFVLVVLLAACSSAPITPMGPADPPVSPAAALPPLASARLGKPRALALPSRPLALSYSPDGRELLVVMREGLYAYAPLQGLLNEVVLEGAAAESGGVPERSCISFEPGRPERLVVAIGGALVHYDRATRTELARWETPASDGCSIAWSADGHELLYVGHDEVMRVDVTRGQVERAAAAPSVELLPTEVPRFDLMVAHRDGDRLAATSGQTRLVVTDASFMRRPQPLDGDWRVLAVAGTRMIARDDEGRVWNVALDRPERIRLDAPVGRGDHIASVSPDGRLVLVGFVANGTRVVDMDDIGDTRIVDMTTGRAIGLPIKGALAAWRSDSRQVAVAARDDGGSPLVYLFDAAGRAALDPDRGAVHQAFVRGDRVAVVTDRVDLFALDGKPLTTLDATDIVHADFDGARLAVIVAPTEVDEDDSGACSLFVYDVASDRFTERWRRPLGERCSREDEQLQVALGERVVVTRDASALVFERDGAVATHAIERGFPLATGAFVDDLDGFMTVRDLDGAELRVSSVTELLAASRDGTTFVTWDHYEGVPWRGLAVRRRGEAMSRWFAPSPDYVGRAVCALDRVGTRVACYGLVGLDAVAIFDVRSGARLGVRAERSGDSIRSVDLSDDGRWLATGSADGTTTLWDLSSLPAAPASPPIASLHEPLFELERELFTEGAVFTWRVDGRAPLGVLDAEDLGGKEGQVRSVKGETLRCAVHDAVAFERTLHAYLWCKGRFHYLLSGATLEAHAGGTRIDLDLDNFGPAEIVVRSPSPGTVVDGGRRDTTTFANGVVCSTRATGTREQTYCTDGSKLTRLTLRGPDLDLTFTPR